MIFLRFKQWQLILYIYTRDYDEHFVQPVKILSFPLYFMNILVARILEKLGRDFSTNSTNVIHDED